MFARILNEPFEKEREMPTKEDFEVTVGGSTKRTFDTGASRDTEAGKLDFEGFLSPPVLERYAEYLNKHRVMADGSTR